jgi:hypothetical protein
MENMRHEIKEMINQLGVQAFLLLGAEDKIYSNKDCSLEFKIQGSPTFKHIKMIYDVANDWYKLVFTDYSDFEITNQVEVDMVFAEDIHDIIEDKTKLYTTLFYARN